MPIKKSAQVLTHNSKTVRMENANACVVWFPFNDGSGNIITDLAGGVVITDNATASHTAEPHAIQFTADGAITTGSTPDIPADKHLIYIDVIKSGTGAGAQNQNFIGTGGTTRQGFWSSFWMAQGGTSVTANIQTQTANSKFVRVGTFNNTTGLLSAYSGKDGATTALDNTADGAAIIGTFNFSNEWKIGSTVNDDVETYGIAVYHVSTLPSAETIIEAADWCYDNWTRGRKHLPPQFADLT